MSRFGNAHAPKPVTREQKRTRATMFIGQHPKPETVTAEMLTSITGCDEAWANYLVAGRA